MLKTKTSQVIPVLDTEIVKAIKDSWNCSPQWQVLQLSKGRRRVLNSIIWLSKNYKSVYATDSYIAKRCKLSREVVNRYKHEFEIYGIIKIIRRGFKKTSLIILSSLFDKSWVRKLLAPFLSAIMCLPLSLLLYGNYTQGKSYVNSPFGTKKNITQVSKESISNKFTNRMVYLTNKNIHSNLYLYEDVIMSTIDRQQERAKALEAIRMFMKVHYREGDVWEQIKRTPIYDMLFPEDLMRVIRVLRPDTPGQIAIAALPTKSVMHSYQTLMNRPSSNNAIAFLIKYAKEHAKQHDLVIGWRWYYDVCEALKIVLPQSNTKNSHKREEHQTPNKPTHGPVYEKKKAMYHPLKVYQEPDSRPDHSLTKKERDYHLAKISCPKTREYLELIYFKKEANRLGITLEQVKNMDIEHHSYKADENDSLL